jgi:hypothetical protein
MRDPTEYPTLGQREQRRNAKPSQAGRDEDRQGRQQDYFGFGSGHPIPITEEAIT